MRFMTGTTLLLNSIMRFPRKIVDRVAVGTGKTFDNLIPTEPKGGSLKTVLSRCYPNVVRLGGMLIRDDETAHRGFQSKTMGWTERSLSDDRQTGLMHTCHGDTVAVRHTCILSDLTSMGRRDGYLRKGCV
jgi:hypothetical protein